MEFDDFVSDQGPPLLRLAFLLCGDAHRAEDLTQIAFTDAFRHWKKVSAADSPEAYLRRMLVNAHHDWYRRRSSGEIPVETSSQDASASWRDDPGELVASRDGLRSALATLPTRARTILVLRYYLDLGDTEIATTLGISASTVRATAARGLARLRALNTLSTEAR